MPQAQELPVSIYVVVRVADPAAVPVLRALFAPDDFERYVLETDDPERIVDFLVRHRELETPSQRLGRYIQQKEAGRG